MCLTSPQKFMVSDKSAMSNSGDGITVPRDLAFTSSQVKCQQIRQQGCDCRYGKGACLLGNVGGCDKCCRRQLDMSIIPWGGGAWYGVPW